MRKLTYIVLIAVGLCHGVAWAAKAGQPNPIDSLVLLFDRQPSVATVNKFLAMLHEDGLVDEPITFTAQTHPDTLRQQMWYWAAEHYYDQQRYAEAESYALKALPLCRVGNDRVIEGDCLSLLSLIYVRQGEFDQAAKYAKLTNELDLKSGDAGNIASSYNTLAGIYMSARQPQEAEKYIKQALVYAEKAGNQQRIAVVLGMASEVYMKLGDAKESLSFATRAYKLECSLGRTDKAAIRQAQRASALISLGRHDEAKTTLLTAIPHLRKGGNRHSLGIACNQMGLLLHQQRNDSAAVRYFNEALQIFLDQKDLFNESHSRKGLYDALRRTDPTTAMLHNDRYNELRDSLYDSETGALLSKYAAEYGYDELQAEHGRLLSTHHLYIIIGVAVVMLLLGCIVFGIRRSRRDRRRMQQLISEIAALKASESELDVPVGESELTTQPQQTDDKPQDDHRGQTANEEDRLFMLRLVKVVNDSLPTGHYGVEEIASRLNMGTQTFRRRVTSLTGESPKTFISAIQMDLAAKLLTAMPDMPVEQIANRCGYDDATSFRRVFRKTYGMSPSQYREQA